MAEEQTRRDIEAAVRVVVRGAKSALGPASRPSSLHRHRPTASLLCVAEPVAPVCARRARRDMTGHASQAAVAAPAEPTVLVAGLWIILCAGLQYSFATYSNDLRTALQLSQSQLEVLALGKDIGAYVGFVQARRARRRRTRRGCAEPPRRDARRRPLPRSTPRAFWRSRAPATRRALSTTPTARGAPWRWARA